MAVCAIARNLKIDSSFLSQIIQLQEKLAVSFGRNRKELSIGVYDLDKIKFPVRYTSKHKTEIKFSPLGYEQEMTAEAILKNHPKGKEFSHLMKDTDIYPVWMDAENKILSMPPIINSNDIGNLTTKTKNVFIECTGYDPKFLLVVIDTIAAQMIDRGGLVESVSNITGTKKVVTPSLATKKFSMDMNYINKVSGLNLDNKTIVSLLKQARYDCQLSGDKLNVMYPSYRSDIMHARDIVEDVIISYGYNNIPAKITSIATRGKLSELETFTGNLYEISIGIGFQEILSYILTNSDNLFSKMNVPQESAVEIENPMSRNWSVFRTWLIPSLLEFLAKNKNVEYPQKIFEIGDCVLLNPKKETKTEDVKKVAFAITDVKVGYEDISSVLDAFMKNVGVNYSLKEKPHTYMINGRSAEIIIGGSSAGFIGEIHPLVLKNWGLQKAVVVFEIDVSYLM